MLYIYIMHIADYIVNFYNDIFWMWPHIYIYIFNKEYHHSGNIYICVYIFIYVYKYIFMYIFYIFRYNIYELYEYIFI